ncbi:MAG: modulator protein [Rhodospirillales bacterium RIFCSPLOWO2_12_FULL_58_28]|nr:MAG: modulator protein [Rhodospirillales bacterium RIFCSPLOWO2_02_FULL_58_16]OHC77224.1 MAG: modulator protein [Rhodospirillales bacterium RIFCSPLOWO2_12_FULL_58_28]
MNSSTDKLSLLGGLIEKTLKAGADSCDALFVEGVSMSHARRLGKPEHIRRSEGADLGLRVLVGKRQAMVSSSDASPEALNELVERAIAMARAVPEDPHCGLAEPEQLATEFPDLDMCDADELSTEDLLEMAARAEDAARAVPGVTNSEGAEAECSRSSIFIVAGNGFAGTYAGTRHSLSVSVLAGEGTGMERDYDFTGAVHIEDLKSPEDIGRSAGEKAVKRLNPRKVKTGHYPVIYDPRVSGSILSHLSSAVNGVAVARGSSFLKNRLGERIFPENITIIDDPHRRRGLRSRPFDGECVAGGRRNIVENGVLVSWILDLHSARKLGMTTTGNASRGTSSPPSPAATNLYLEPGAVCPKDLMADIKSGFYVTELIGFGINQVTGDYSRGAGGFWIENGELTFPVSEVTVAGNLNHMFANITAADDLEFRYGVDAPTLRIDGLMTAGA